ncbi:hypothetical protein HPB47_013496 [Ixodes persulcatus]|uniref:Uncharacterized protein n=1 Tax=Ixodes persulcatus TaxID=34615 RepID=A0AC60R3S7_IXOPE|nr:hypothetical protein HPB47_013496 [Ixodes persulcatus]
MNTIPLTMQVDTGAPVSVLPLDLYKKRFPNLVKGRSGVVLRAFMGNKVKPVGEAQVEVEYRNQVPNSPLQIVDFKGPPLLTVYVAVLNKLQLGEDCRWGSFNVDLNLGIRKPALCPR